jgi:hypothetical protein
MFCSSESNGRKKMKLGVFVLAFLSFSSLGFACTEDGTGGLLPENSMKIPVGDKAANNISKKDFSKALEKVRKVYAPIFAQKGLDLEIENHWDDSTVNAYAIRKDGKAVVAIFGGLGRHYQMTTDGVILAACHESGHHIGGIPIKVNGPGVVDGDRVTKIAWASNEGQADYFGVMKCFRKVIEGEDHRAVLKKVNIEEKLKDSCNEEFTLEEDRLICMRSVAAGLSITSLFVDVINAELEKTGKPERLPLISSEKPDNRIVNTMDDNHPLPQCRFDTFLNGALCDKTVDQEVSYSDPDQGVCSRRDGYTVGVRPLCWYKEDNFAD